MYLVAIIDLFSRYIVGWGISNTMEAEATLSVLKQAINDHGKPEIINSDQGSQFTSTAFVELVQQRFGCALDEVVMVGDRLDTDVAFAAAYGMRSILVLKLDQLGDVVLTQPLIAALRRAGTLE